MSKHIDYQVIEQEGTPAFAVVPWDEFKKLLDDFDQEPADKARIPHEVVKLHIVDELPLIKAWRKYLKLSQGEMAQRLDVSQPAYSQIENGDPLTHRRATLEKVAEALGVEFEQINMSLENSI